MDIFTKKKLLSIIITSSILLTVGCGEAKFDKTLEFIEKNNIEKATEYYVSLKSEEKLEVDKVIKNKIDEQYEKFINDELKTKEATTEISSYKVFTGVEDYIKEVNDKISELYSSQLNFKSGQKYENLKQYDTAIKHYKKVIQIDEENHKIAQEKIGQLQVLYDKQYAEKLAKQQEQVEEKLKQYTITTAILPNQFDLYDGVQLLISNNTDKTVKEFKVGIFIYDKNGYPIKTGILAGREIYMTVYESNANIMPNQTFGSDKVVNTYLDYGTIGYVKANIIEVTDYDGGKWTNTNHSQWYLENFDKKYEE